MVDSSAYSVNIWIKDAVDDGLAEGGPLTNIHTHPRGGFAIPLSLAQERPCISTGLGHWSPRHGRAHVNAILYTLSQDFIHSPCQGPDHLGPLWAPVGLGGPLWASALTCTYPIDHSRQPGLLKPKQNNTLP